MTAGKGLIAGLRAARDKPRGFPAELQERMSGFRDKRIRCLGKVEQHLGLDFTREEGETLREVAGAYCEAFQDLFGARSRLFEIVDQLPDLGDWTRQLADIPCEDDEWPELMVDAQMRDTVLHVEMLIGVLADMDAEARKVLEDGSGSDPSEGEAVTGLRQQLLEDLRDICGPEREQ